MGNKSIFKANTLLVNVSKEECEDLRKFTKEHGIIMKIGDFEEYSTLFPTKILMWYDKTQKIHIAALATSMYVLYVRDYIEIDFKHIKTCLKN